VYLPRQFFVEWLPSQFADSIALSGGALVRRGAAPAPAPARDTAAQPLGTPAPPPRPAPTARERARVVVIDAGHGGPDAGAQGPGGIREKDVTLGIALRLAALLRSQPGYEVHLTRTTDTLISLFDRPRLANDWKDERAAALFISIHANSHRDAGAQGFETFILSEARTADERAVAERENAAASYDEDRRGPQDEMSFILSDLRNEFYVHASHDLATLVQGQIDPLHPGLNRGVKQAAFVVLVGAFMPAVLVETAFISNPGEARMLASSSFQDQMAMALSRAVHQFFDTHAYLSPEGGE
jgi:N-acetylmuramoyl-L-alanine amidase